MSQRLRVINLGLPKSGTTTLARALRRSNLHVADHRIQPQQTAREDLHEVFVGDLLYRGLYHADDPLADLDEFDALSEISALRERHPIWPQTDWGLIEAIRILVDGQVVNALVAGKTFADRVGLVRLQAGDFPVGDLGDQCTGGFTDPAKCWNGFHGSLPDDSVRLANRARAGHDRSTHLWRRGYGAGPQGQEEGCDRAAMIRAMDCSLTVSISSRFT